MAVRKSKFLVITIVFLTSVIAFVITFQTYQNIQQNRTDIYNEPPLPGDYSETIYIGTNISPADEGKIEIKYDNKETNREYGKPRWTPVKKENKKEKLNLYEKEQKVVKPRSLAGAVK